MSPSSPKLGLPKGHIKVFFRLKWYFGIRLLITGMIIGNDSSSSFTRGFMFSRLTVLSLLLCICLNPSSAAGDTITTFELGGASNSPGIADKNHLIIEEDFMSYQTKFKGDKSYNYQLGQTKLRYGLIENKLEARVSSAGVTVNELDSG
ncbi:MAG: hypothetical protein ACKO3R_07245, partial [bacterium]